MIPFCCKVFELFEIIVGARERRTEKTETLDKEKSFVRVFIAKPEKFHLQKKDFSSFLSEKVVDFYDIMDN